jgi:UDP-N-acetylmuramoylalanine--D-glutamate ligase
LAIYPDHLDYHQNFDEYKTAKLNITKFQTPSDYLICHESHKDVATAAQKIILSLSDWDPAIKTNLPGDHNKLNTLPAITIAKMLNIPADKIYTAIYTFIPLETRLEPVAEKKGVKFYADTLATIPQATIAAIDTLNPTTLIAGGHDRHQNYRDLAQKILASGIKTLILFPETGPRIAAQLQGYSLQGCPQIFSANSMSEAVQLAFAHTPPGQICLLSPAAPSFTLFKDYKDEYNQYKEAIEKFILSKAG